MEYETKGNNLNKSDTQDFLVGLYLLIADFMEHCHPAVRVFIHIICVVLFTNGMFTAGHNLGELIQNIVG